MSETQDIGSWPRCTEASRAAIFVYDYIQGSISFIASVLMLVVLIKYIHAKIHDKMKVSNPSYYGGLMLFICSFGHLLSYGNMQMAWCHNYARYVLFYNLQTMFYVADYILLIGLLYNNLFTIFKDTTMSISTTTHRVFWSLYIFEISMGLLTSFFFIYSPSTKSFNMIFYGGATLTCIVLISCLIYGFVHKLYTVYRQSATENEENMEGVKAIITKSSMLALISITNTILSMTFLGMLTVVDAVYPVFIVAVFYTTDTLSNGICIFLQYKHFQAYYKSICGSCDRGWRVLWMRCTGHTAKKGDDELPMESTGGQGSIASLTVQGQTSSVNTSADFSSDIDVESGTL